MKKIIKLMVIVVSVIAAMVLVVLLFMQQASFGKAATGDRLSRILHSTNYSGGKFQNQSYTPDIAEDVSFFKVLNDFLFKRSKRNKPAVVLPS
ncbi:MAG TPA: hypothetical protein VGK10_19355, partial [Prolixibacteraceae bacterium]